MDGGTMKALLSVISLALLMCCAGCSTLREMNTNIVKTNELMDDNIAVTSSVEGTIQDNTTSVNRSTDSMIEFEGIIANNSEAITRVMDEVETHSHVLSMGVIAFLLLLFLPSLILVIFYFKFIRNMKSILGARK